jgi:hypothetical protein
MLNPVPGNYLLSSRNSRSLAALGMTREILAAVVGLLTSELRLLTPCLPILSSVSCLLSSS